MNVEREGGREEGRERRSQLTSSIFLIQFLIFSKDFSFVTS